VGARLKVQAKAKLDQISGVPMPREGVVQDVKAGGLESINREEPQLRSVAMG
jgi:hypothetical protein